MELMRMTPRTVRVAGDPKRPPNAEYNHASKPVEVSLGRQDLTDYRPRLAPTEAHALGHLLLANASIALQHQAGVTSGSSSVRWESRQYMAAG